MRANAAAVLVALVMCGGRASAAPNTADIALSDSLAREGRSLIQRGRIMDGCQKLLEADRVVSRAEVLVELAECYQRAGYPGAADEVLRRAAKLAHDNNQTDIEGALASRVGNVEAVSGSIRVVVRTPARVPGLLVTLDGRVVELDDDGTATRAVDPLLITAQAHVLIASAPKYRTFRTQFHLARGQSQTVTISRLEREVSTTGIEGVFKQGPEEKLVGPTERATKPGIVEVTMATGAAAFLGKRKVFAGVGGGPGLSLHLTEGFALYANASANFFIGKLATATVGVSYQHRFGAMWEPLAGVQGTGFFGEHIEVLSTSERDSPPPNAFAPMGRLVPLRFAWNNGTASALGVALGAVPDGAGIAIAVAVNLAEVGLRF